MFAVITPTLMTGAFTERLRLKPFIFFIIAWSILVYYPFVHMIWAAGGLLFTWGVRDFAGGIVVHTTAGFSALASVIVLGSRKELAELTEKYSEDENSTPHNIPFCAVGTALLWFGWVGFNAGSALHCDSVATYAAVNSEIAAAMALCSWMAVETWHTGRSTLVGACVGAVAGLATVTPAAGYITPQSALLLGFVASPFCYFFAEMRTFFGWDDALDCWAVHGMGGVLGSILLGALADPNVNVLQASWELLGKQTAAVAFCAAYSFVVTFLMLKLIGYVMELSPSPEDVTKGLDWMEQGVHAYSRNRIKKKGRRGSLGYISGDTTPGNITPAGNVTPRGYGSEADETGPLLPKNDSKGPASSGVKWTSGQRSQPEGDDINQGHGSNDEHSKSLSEHEDVSITPK